MEEAKTFSFFFHCLFAICRTALAALAPQVIKENINVEKVTLVYDGGRLALFLSLGRYQELYNWYLYFLNVSSNTCNEKTLGLHVYLSHFYKEIPAS